MSAEAEPIKIKRRFTFVRFEDIRPPTSGAYLVRHVIPREGLVVVWGPPKCGKTFWVLDLVMHIALGWEYRGRRVKAGPIAYVACEGEQGLRRRVEAFRRTSLAEEHNSIPFHLLTDRLDLPNEHAVLIADLRAHLGGGPCCCIVLDTLNRSIGGKEDDELMGAYIRASDALREAFNCAVIIVHHCGVDDRRPRGHTSLTGAVDAQIKVTKDTVGAVRAEVEFLKDGEAGAEIRSTLKVVDLDDDEDGERVTSCVIEAADGESAAPARRKKTSGAAQVVLDLLRKAVDEAGVPAPASNHIPPGARVVSLELLKNYAYEGSISDADTPESKRKAFARSLTKLKSEGLINFWGDHVWLV